MSNINDYKIVRKKSREYYDLLNISTQIGDDIEKERIGFYYLVLRCVTGETDFDTITDMIIDDKFCGEILSIKNVDLGVDAVYIDEEKHEIKLFNFKYRISYKEDTSVKETDAYSASRFLGAIQSEKIDKLTERTKHKAKEIINKLHSDDIYSIELVMVANVEEKIEINQSLEVFKEPLDLKINSVILDDIVNYLAEYPKDIEAKLLIENDSVLHYEPDKLSTNKSYVIKISLAELIRITCSDSNLRNTQIGDYEVLKNAKLDYSLLYENIRGYLGDTKYNKSIIKTIIESPNDFFLYNNGITITAKSITAISQNAGKKLSIDINGFQIVNGGQTIRSLYKFLENCFDVEKISSGFVLVRLFQTSKDNALTNNIAEYTNSQNAISSSDLKSVSNLQRQIETYLDTNGISYIRKVGDIGKETLHDKRITMEKMAQIIYSHNGYPERAASSKKKLFEKYYSDIFPDEFDLEKCYSIAETYFQVKKNYEETDYEKYEQKYLYVVYMKTKCKRKTEKELIDLLENVLNGFEIDSKLSPSRKLLKKNFKKALDEELNKL